MLYLFAQSLQNQFFKWLENYLDVFRERSSLTAVNVFHFDFIYFVSNHDRSRVRPPLPWSTSRPNFLSVWASIWRQRWGNSPLNRNNLGWEVECPITIASQKMPVANLLLLSFQQGVCIVFQQDCTKVLWVILFLISFCWADVEPQLKEQGRVSFLLMLWKRHKIHFYFVTSAEKKLSDGYWLSC